MPRPCKRRRVCAMPDCNQFGPIENGASARKTIVMTVDEYECIRLIDLEGFTQEACAESMNVARTTVQAIYTSARTKLAECLVNAARLTIAGGDYVLCSGNAEQCSCGQCRKRRCSKEDRAARQCE